MMKIGLDSQYSWLVAIASSFIYLLSSWPLKVGGQLFVFLLDDLNINRKNASFPFSLAYLMKSVSGPFAGYFGAKIGLRAVTLIGCFLCAIGMLGCFFAGDIISLDIYMGIIFGFGVGWSTSVIPEILNQHFDKHLGKANGIVLGGSVIGAFATPPLVVITTKTFGISGTFLIMSAVILNSVPLAMLLTKPNYRKKPSLAVSTITKSTTVKNDSNNVSHFGDSSIALHCIDDKGETKDVESCEEHKNYETCDYVVNKDIIKSNLKEDFHCMRNSLNQVETPVAGDFSIDKNMIFHEANKVALNQSCEIGPSFIRNSSDFELHFDDTPHQSEKDNLPALFRVSELPDKITSVRNRRNSVSSNNKTNNVLVHTSNKSSYSTIKLLLSPLFLLMATIQSSHIYVIYITRIITVDVARDKGATEDQEVYFVMGYSLFDMFGRLFFGALTDSRCVTRVNLNVISYACIGFCCLLLTWVSGFIASLLTFCMLGLSSGSTTTGLPGLVNHFFQNEERSMAMASRFIMFAPMSFTMSPLIGYFREVLDSYDGLLYLFTLINVLCSIILILLRHIYRR